jgi:hypothetical protein
MNEYIKTFKQDFQVLGSFTGRGDLVFDSLMKTAKLKMKYYMGLDLFSTYSYTIQTRK